MRRLVNVYLTDFMVIKPMKVDNAAALSDLNTKTIAHRINGEIVTSCFSQRIQDAWCNKLGSSSEPTILKALKDFTDNHQLI